MLDENDSEKFKMQLNAMIALSKLKLLNIEGAREEFTDVNNWFDQLKEIPDNDQMFYYYIGYSLFQLNKYYGNDKEANLILEKAYNNTGYVKEYNAYKLSGRNDRYELAKYFWVADIIDNYQEYIEGEY